MARYAAYPETLEFESRTQKSRDLFKKSSILVPSGVHSNYRLIDPYPIFCVRAQGDRIWDVDSNEYIDFNMAFGTMLAGHANPEVISAATEAIQHGTIFGFEPASAPELSSIISSRFHLDMVRISTTGLEGTLNAIRVARAYTGRSKILKFEGCYHGSHDGLLVSVKPSEAAAGDARQPNAVPASKGVTSGALEDTLVAQFNDLESVELVMQKNEGGVAAVILEPIAMNMGFVQPVKGFLAGLRKLCDKHGSLLIFDEVKTCGKFYHGASGQFAVRPDLAVLGKAIAGGFPLSVLGGRKEVMESIVPGKVSNAGTFNSNPLSVAAAIATLTRVLKQDEFLRLSRLSGDMGRAYRDTLVDAGIAGNVSWLGPSGALFFGRGAVRNWRDFLRCDVGLWWRYYLSMLNRGIIPCATGPDEQWSLSVMHTEESVQKHIEAWKGVLSRLRGDAPKMDLVEAV